MIFDNFIGKEFDCRNIDKNGIVSYNKGKKWIIHII
jgi:hypothetical protein